MKQIIKLPLVLLSAFTLFMVVPINGATNLLYLFEYSSISQISILNFVEKLILLLLLISHLFIFLLPFLTRSKNFFNILTFAPIAFVISYFLLNISMIFALIPFIIMWVICQFLRKEFKIKSN
mgnify:CR=1 FL=1